MGYAKDIGAGGEGSVFVVGAASSYSTRSAGLYKFKEGTNGNWKKVGNSGDQIAVGPGGRPHVIRDDGRMYQAACSIVRT